MQASRMLTTTLAPIGRFIRHAFEMCLAMCIGAVTLNLLIWGGASLLGYTDLTERFPELSAFVVTLTLSLPMVAWMRFRGHESRHTAEMVLPTVITGVLLIGLYWLGAVGQNDLIRWQFRLACPVMIAVMVLRFSFYSQGHRTHGVGAHHVATEGTAS